MNKKYRKNRENKNEPLTSCCRFFRRDFQNFSLTRGVLDGAAQTPSQGLGGSAPDGRRSLCDSGLEDGERRASAMDFWTCRTAATSSGTAGGGARAEGGPDSPRQPPDSPNQGADVRRKQLPWEDAGEGGEGPRAEAGARRKGVLDGGFLGRKRAPPVPHLSSLPSGSEGGGSDSSSNASPSPTKVTSSTSPRHRKLAAEPSNQDSSL